MNDDRPRRSQRDEGTSGLTMAERRELGAMLEQLGRQAEAESWTQRLEAEARDSPATPTMVTGTRTVQMVG